MAATSPVPRPAKALGRRFTERRRDRPGTTTAVMVPLPAAAAILATPRVGDGLCPILGAIAAAVALGLAFLAS